MHNIKFNLMRSKLKQARPHLHRLLPGSFNFCLRKINQGLSASSSMGVYSSDSSDWDGG